VGYAPAQCNSKGKNAEQQFVVLERSWDCSGTDYILEISTNRKAVYLNCCYWLQRDFSHLGVDPDLKAAALAGILKAWSHSSIHPALPAAFTRKVLLG